jgi:hypothetical protein
MPKVTIVGAGQVGSTTALRLADRGIADVAIIDVDGELARGKALDLAQALPLSTSSVEVAGGDDYRLGEGSEVAVIAATVVADNAARGNGSNGAGSNGNDDGNGDGGSGNDGDMPGLPKGNDPMLGRLPDAGGYEPRERPGAPGSPLER